MYDEQQIASLRKEMDRRLASCPLFLKLALRPVPTLLQGRIPFDHFLERQADACTTWMHCREDVKADLEESFSQEGELLMDIYNAIVEIGDFSTQEARDLLKERVCLAAEAYLARPEQERKCFLF